MAVTPKGVRMINNNVVQSGMALVMTDRDVMDWNHIPDGSLFVHPETGDIMIKVKGESDWIPLPDHIKKDGTLVISRDTSLHIEVFKIISIDEANHQFTYENERGERQTKIKDENGFVFQLAGSYLPGRNHLSVTFDDVLDRSAASGGIEEIDEHRFRVKEDIPVGTEVTAKYIKWVRIGNPYPRIYESQTMARLDEEDNPIDAEIGDMYLDWHATLDGLEDLSIDELMELEIDWSQIRNKPKTLSGYGITDAAHKNHTHKIADVTGLEQAIRNAMPSNVDATTLQGLSPDKTYKGTAKKIAVYDANGKLPVSAIPSNIGFQVGMIMDWYGNSSTPPTGWAICDGRTQNGIKTPDLRGKFIIGGGTSGTYIGSTRKNNSAAPVKSGGASSVALKKANLPPHDHTHTHKHKHTRGTMNITGRVGAALQDYAYPNKAFYVQGGNVPEAADGNWGAYNVNFDASRSWTGATSEDATKNSASTNSSDFKSTAFNIIPPYVALFKIMYVGV